MTREPIAFDYFIDVDIKTFEDLVRLHEDYVALYENYIRVFIDDPKSRTAVLGLLRNVERVQVAIGQTHEQIFDVKDYAEENNETVSEYMRTISDALKKLEENIPGVELSLLKSNVEEKAVGDVIEFGDVGSLSCKETIDAKGSSIFVLEAYVMDNKTYLACAEGRHDDITLWDVSSKCKSGTLVGHNGSTLSLTVYEKDDKLYLASGGSDGII